VLPDSGLVEPPAGALRAMHVRNVQCPTLVIRAGAEPPLVSQETAERLTREIVGFCGLGWDDACLRHEGNKHLIMTPSIWQARQPVYRAAVGRGQRYEKWLSDFHRLLDHRKPVTEAANQTRTGRGQAGAQEKTPADRTDAAKEGS